MAEETSKDAPEVQSPAADALDEFKSKIEGWIAEGVAEVQKLVDEAAGHVETVTAKAAEVADAGTAEAGGDLTAAVDHLDARVAAVEGRLSDLGQGGDTPADAIVLARHAVASVNALANAVQRATGANVTDVMPPAPGTPSLVDVSQMKVLGADPLGSAQAGDTGPVEQSAG